MPGMIVVSWFPRWVALFGNGDWPCAGGLRSRGELPVRGRARYGWASPVTRKFRRIPSPQGRAGTPCTPLSKTGSPNGAHGVAALPPEDGAHGVAIYHPKTAPTEWPPYLVANFIYHGTSAHDG